MQASRPLLFLVCLLIAVSGHAQQLLQLKGRVTDAADQSGLPLATISVHEMALGTATNEDGYFVLRLPQSLRSEHLVVSFVGYESIKVPVEVALAEPELRFALKPLEVHLQEVEIKPLQGLALVQEAIARIPRNYASQPKVLEAFYRETIRANQQYRQLTEAVLHIYKGEYASSGGLNDQVRLVEGRQLQNSDSGRFTLNISGGPTGSNSMDLVMRKKGPLNPEDLGLYEYHWAGMTSYEGRPVYIVDFDQKQKVKKALEKGQLYIDQESMAIIGISSGLSDRGRKHLNAMSMMNSVKASLFGIKMDLTNRQHTVRYRLHNSKWHLHYAKSEVALQIKPGRSQQPQPYLLSTEILVTDVQQGLAQPFAEAEVLKSKEVLHRKITSYDAGFWDNYTIIEPSQAVKQIAGQLAE